MSGPQLLPSTNPLSASSDPFLVVSTRLQSRRRPWVALGAVAVLSAVVVYDHFWAIPSLDETIRFQDRVLQDKRRDVALLEARLSPFKNAARSRYGDDTGSSLLLLASALNQTEPTATGPAGEGEIANRPALPASTNSKRAQIQPTPRRLSSEARSAIAAVVQGNQARPVISLACRATDGEAEAFARDIAGFMKQLGFPTAVSTVHVPTVPAGVILNQSHPDASLIEMIGLAFTRAGLKVAENPPAQVIAALPPAIAVFVGAKPE